MSSYLKISAGNRLGVYLGLKMDEEVKYSFPKFAAAQMSYIDVPIRTLVNTSDNKESRQALRNQFVEVHPSCTVKPNGVFKFDVHPSRSFDSYGTHSGSWIEEVSDLGEHVPKFNLWLRKDIDLDSEEFYIRIYMRE